MDFRYYIIPLVEHYPSYRQPKYFVVTPVYDGGGLYMTTLLPEIRYPNDPTIGFKKTHYGLNNVMLIMAPMTDAQHTLLSSKSDVISFPLDLTKNLTSAAITNVTPKLEAFNIPVDWLSTSLTYKQALRRICRMFKVFRRLHERFTQKIFDPGFGLNSQYKDFSALTKNHLLGIALEFNIDLTQYDNTTTIREIVKVLMNAQSGDSWPAGDL